MPVMERGEPYSLGAQWDGEGVNFALFSAHAERVVLCLYDDQGEREIARYELPEKTHDIWHGYVPGLAPGAVYGYRVYGPFDPLSGRRFNPHKLLLDPYARQLKGSFRWHNSHHGYPLGHQDKDLVLDKIDNANWMVKGVVTGPRPRPKAARPRIPWHLTSIYETHVRGLTRQHPGIDAALRGSYSAMADDKVIAYIKSLGITSIELLPVHAFVDEPHLVAKGLTNYWGYNSLNFFVPHPAYQSGTDPGEFQAMVERLHDAGLEVILDVVYNHTAEGSELGPTLSFRGIDNLSYYHLQAGQPRFYVNDSGCGNTVNVSHPRVMQMIMDSLRYWVVDMGVDGFRFDLAPVLGRKPQGFTARAAFFQAVAQDPQLKGCKLIAEPWDIGPGGYRLGQFPGDWSEWNDDYRDTVRRFWLREPGTLATFARRLHGSSDLFEGSSRGPRASINLVTSHDGFTLHDLNSYRERHNEANGEGNNDGHRANYSDNFGIEGKTDNARIQAMRRRQQRNMLATLLISQGVPMLLAGDERYHTQQGNNNAYCQDNPLTWIDWSGDQPFVEELLAFVRRMLQIRREHPILSHDRYIHNSEDVAEDLVQWLNSDGEKMNDRHWHDHGNFLFGYLLRESGNGPGTAKHILTIFNNSGSARAFRLPDCEVDIEWSWLIDTVFEDGVAQRGPVPSRSRVHLAARSVVILASAPLRAV